MLSSDPNSRLEHSIAASYSAAAAAYADTLGNELAGKPMDRRLLTLLADRVDQSGVICDLCCGPGQIAAYLATMHARVMGVDISPGMAREASIRHRDIPFCVGNIRTLTPGTNWCGIACFYGIVHLDEEGLQESLEAMARALKHGGLLLLAFHCGNEEKAVNSLFGVDVDLKFRYFPLSSVLSAVRDAGFSVELALERAPYPEAEYPSRRGYILANLR